MTAHFDKAFFPSLFAVSTTENGKKIFTGKARYAGLDGAGTPTACVNAILSRSKPKNVQTHACPHQKTARMCLKQPDTHVWFGPLASCTTPLWQCMPSTDGYH